MNPGFGNEPVVAQVVPSPAGNDWRSVAMVTAVLSFLLLLLVGSVGALAYGVYCMRHEMRMNRPNTPQVRLAEQPVAGEVFQVPPGQRVVFSREMPGAEPREAVGAAPTNDLFPASPVVPAVDIEEAIELAKTAQRSSLERVLAGMEKHLYLAGTREQHELLADTMEQHLDLFPADVARTHRATLRHWRSRATLARVTGDTSAKSTRTLTDEKQAELDAHRKKLVEQSQAAAKEFVDKFFTDDDKPITPMTSEERLEAEARRALGPEYERHQELLESIRARRRSRYDLPPTYDRNPPSRETPGYYTPLR